MLVNRAKLAEIFGVSTPTVDNWVKAGCPYISRPVDRVGGWEFEVAAVVDWMVGQAQRKAGDGSQAGQLQRAQLRDAEAKATIREMDMAARQKVLIHVDQVAPVLEPELARIRNRIAAIPEMVVGALAAESNADACHRILTGAVNDALDDISRDDVAAEAEG